MSSINSPLLSFLLTHEEAFRSRARLASLYSDFRAQASTNPDGYAANVSAWRKALADAAKAGLLPAGDLLVVKTGEELLRELEMAGWGRPGALGAVVVSGRMCLHRRDIDVQSFRRPVMSRRGSLCCVEERILTALWA